MPLIATKRVELHYDLTGPADAPAIVFSNSLAARLEMWDPQAAVLSRHYRCLRYDTRGHGRSPVVDGPVSIDDLADDLASLMDALAVPKAHIVGLSLGGMTAQAFGIRHGARARSLSLLATAAHLPPPDAWQARADLVRSKGMAPIADTVMERWFTAPFRAAQPGIVGLAHADVLRTDPRGYAVCAELIRDMDLRGRIGAITAPTLVMVGSEDPGTPPALSEEIRRLIPHADMVVVARAAHLLTLEQPEAVTAYLSAFLSRIGDAA